jgi:2-methylisocitrate lyase-like PEP mutase family enzyme
MNEQQKKAERLLALHHSPEPLVLPNVWDVSSAMIFALEGFKAIGTTSAGVAATIGYADGQEMTLADNISIVERIVRNTSLPVSADMESGYATSVDGVVTCARAVLDSGAVGLNLEDSTGKTETPLFDKAEQQEKIRAIRAMSESQDIHLVINARTDAYLVGDDDADCLRSAIDRGNAYREAGADCIFVPDVGNLDRVAIRTLVDEIDAPINIIAGATSPTVAELQGIGVARVSLGPRPMRAVLSLLRQIAKELAEAGTYELMSEASISYDEVNEWFSNKKS